MAEETKKKEPIQVSTQQVDKLAEDLAKKGKATDLISPDRMKELKRKWAELNKESEVRADIEKEDRKDRKDRKGRGRPKGSKNKAKKEAKKEAKAAEKEEKRKSKIAERLSNAEKGLTSAGNEKKDRRQTEEQKNERAIERAHNSARKQIAEAERRRGDGIENEAPWKNIAIPIGKSATLTWRFDPNRLREKGAMDLSLESEGRRQEFTDIPFPGGYAEFSNKILPVALNGADLRRVVQFPDKSVGGTADSGFKLTKTAEDWENAFRTGDFTGTPIVEWDNVGPLGLPRYNIRSEQYILPPELLKQMDELQKGWNEDLMAQGIDPKAFSEALAGKKAELAKAIKEGTADDFIKQFLEEWRGQTSANTEAVIKDLTQELKDAKAAGDTEKVERLASQLTYLHEARDKGWSVERDEDGNVKIQTTKKAARIDTAEERAAEAEESGDDKLAEKYRKVIRVLKKKPKHKGVIQNLFEGTDELPQYRQDMWDIKQKRAADERQMLSDAYEREMAEELGPEGMRKLYQRNNDILGRNVEPEDFEKGTTLSKDFKNKYNGLLWKLGKQFGITMSQVKQVLDKQRFRDFVTRTDDGKAHYDYNEVVDSLGPELSQVASQNNITDALAGRVM